MYGNVNVMVNSDFLALRVRGVKAGVAEAIS